MGKEVDLGVMLETGEIDALISADVPKCVLSKSPKVGRLFEDMRRPTPIAMHDTPHDKTDGVLQCAKGNRLEHPGNGVGVGLGPDSPD